MTPTLQRLTARGRALVQRVKPQSASVRNVLKLAGGTAGSQVITVAAAPILTRLYGPESFGVLATFASILALLNVVSSLRYELAIAVPEDDDEAIALVWLCFVLVAISTALTALGVALLGDQLASWLDQPALKTLLWLVPVGVLLAGVYQVLSYWAIRRKQFGLLAKTKLNQSITSVTLNLALAPFGSIGLLLGQIASTSSGIYQILTGSSRPTSTILTGKSKVKIRTHLANGAKVAKNYWRISIYNSFAGLINSLYPLLYSFVLSSTGNIEALGMLFLAKRLVDAPSALVSKSAGDVFLSQVARAKGADLYKLCKRNIMFLTISSASILMPYVLVLVLFGDRIFGVIWEPRIQIYLACLVPSSVLQIALGSTGLAFVTSDKNLNGLFAQIGMLLFRLVPIAILSIYGGPIEILPQLVCLGLFMGYSFYGLVLFQSLAYAKV